MIKSVSIASGSKRVDANTREVLLEALRAALIARVLDLFNAFAADANLHDAKDRFRQSLETTSHLYELAFHIVQDLTDEDRYHGD